LSERVDPGALRVGFLGSGDIALPSFLSLSRHPGVRIVALVTQPDKPAGRGMKIRIPAMKRAALEMGLPVLQPRRLRAPGGDADLRLLGPDLLVVMAYGQILPKAVLDLPPRGCINLHASLLPKHRGASPIQAAILSGDRETGVTVMYMDEGLDTGDVMFRRATPIGRRETAGTLHDRLAGLAAEAVSIGVDLLLAGTAPRVPQDAGLATYAPKLSKADGLVDWSRPAGAIGRQLRAMSPWPGAFTFLPLADGRMLRAKIIRAAVLHRGSHLPGRVLGEAHGGLRIGAGQGSLALLDIQPEGGRVMPVRDFLRGHGVVMGGTCGVAEPPVPPRPA